MERTSEKVCVQDWDHWANVSTQIWTKMHIGEQEPESALFVHVNTKVSLPHISAKLGMNSHMWW